MKLFTISTTLLLTGLAVTHLLIPAWAEKAEEKPNKKTEKKQEDDKGKVAVIMHKFYADLLALKPYIVSPKAFEDPKNEKKIKKRIDKMTKDIAQAEKEGVLGSALHKVSMEAFYDHMQELGVVFDRGNKKYAHWMLNSMTSLCVSCHTQLPQAGQPDLAETDNYKKLSGERLFREAEFYFVTRRFDLAESGFRKAIKNYPENKLGIDDLETAVRRTLAIYARIKRDPVLGAARMKEILGNKKLPKFLRKNVSAWMGLFNRWEKEGKIDVDEVTSQELLKFAKEKLKPDLWDKMVDAGDPQVVTFLRVSGLLYEYLFKHPKDKYTPNMLLLLARCEQKLKNEFFFSLGDLYLRECIVKYPKSAAAKECYKEYEESVIASYSGSSGTHLPSDVKQSLRALKAKVYGKKKSEK